MIARLEALIAEEPLRERLHAQRMLALYRDGRQSEALDAYREARETLIEQIGVEPGPELKRLQEQILAQDPSLDAPPPVVELPVQLEGGSPLLAGRERELHWLRRRWARAREGRVVCVMVWGPPGIGKTRLVAELAAEVQREGAAVLYAGGGEVAEAALATVAEAGSGPPTDAAGARLRRRRPAERCSRPPRRSPASPRAERSWSASFITTSRARPPSPPCSRAAPPSACASTRWARMRRPRSPRSTRPPRASRCPFETLLAESEGVPLRIHRAAGEWARAEAAERLAATAGRAADDRTELRATQAAVAGGVVDLQTATRAHPPLRGRGAARPLGAR